MCHAQHAIIPSGGPNSSGGAGGAGRPQRGLFSRLFGSEERPSAALSDAVSAQSHPDEPQLKVLLLSAGRQGKSTFFKDLRRGWDDVDRESFGVILRSNLWFKLQWAARQLEEGSPKLAERLKQVPNPDQKGSSPDAVQEFLADKAVLACEAKHEREGANIGDVAATRSVRERARAIWQGAGAEYVCSDEDVLAAYVRTSGIVENPFACEGTTVNVFDVGGQRNERKKWIHCFDDVSGVVLHFRLDAYNDL